MKIRCSKNKSVTYKISVDGLGYCCGTNFIYVKSEDSTEKANCNYISNELINTNNILKGNNDNYKFSCRKKRF